MANRRVTLVVPCCVALAFTIATGCSSSDKSGSRGGGSGSGSGEPSGPNQAAGTGAKAAGGGSTGALGASLPFVTPPVRAATPPGMAGSQALAPAHPASVASLGLTDAPQLDPSDIKSRFFGAGPTDIFRILADIDGRITDINARSKTSTAACLDQAPVPYTLAAFGQSTPFYAQCYEGSGGPSAPPGSGFFQFGQKDGSTYLFSTSAVGPVAARLTPVGARASGADAGDDADAGDAGGASSDAAGEGGSSGGYIVHVWIGIGDGKTTGGSYGVIELLADSSAMTFEVSVAGIGFGYCGAQLKADAMSVYGIGSTDMGATCNQPGTLCASASDVLVPGTCGDALKSFVLPALGRLATMSPNGSMGASAYPGEPNNHVTLDYSSTDSVSFGPTSPTPGVGAL